MSHVSYRFLHINLIIKAFMYSVWSPRVYVLLKVDIVIVKDYSNLTKIYDSVNKNVAVFKTRSSDQSVSQRLLRASKNQDFTIFDQNQRFGITITGKCKRKCVSYTVSVYYV